MGAALFFAVWYRAKLVTESTSFRTLLLLLLFAIGVGIHGISHALLEKFYGWNPLRALNQQ